MMHERPYGWRDDFPLFHQTDNHHSLVYLDNAATTQKPKVVIDSMSFYYQNANANVHRGLYSLSQKSSALYDEARKEVQQFINAAHSHEIIFTSGATEAINLIAYCFERSQIKAGDEIIISAMEHHSNIVPWQIVCQQKGANLKIIPLGESGELDLDALSQLLSEKTKLVSVTHVSNVLGTINPIKEIVMLAHQKNVPVLVDGAQAIGHMAVNVQDLDVDFYVFSAHKMYGPTGVGVLYGKTEWLDRLPPYQSGGDMIRYVTFEKTEYNDLPHKFEAGTPNIAGVIGLAAAIRYLQNIGINAVMHHEKTLTQFLMQKLSEVAEIEIIHPTMSRTGVISFVMQGAHPHDLATILNEEGIAIRAGHHCAMPLMERLGLTATARVSLGLYNQENDIQRLVNSFKKVKEILGIQYV